MPIRGKMFTNMVIIFTNKTFPQYHTSPPCTAALPSRPRVRTNTHNCNESLFPRSVSLVLVVCQGITCKFGIFRREWGSEGVREWGRGWEGGRDWGEPRGAGRQEERSVDCRCYLWWTIPPYSTTAAVLHNEQSPLSVVNVLKNASRSVLFSRRPRQQPRPIYPD